MTETGKSILTPRSASARRRFAALVALAVALAMSSASWAAGEKITFHSQRDGNQQIYSMDPDGSNQTRLTNNIFTDGEPTWSPGGSRIAFITNRDANTEIYVMDADGTNQINLTNAGSAESQPAWSPDGSKIAFQTNRDDGGGLYDIYVMDADGNNPTRLTTDPEKDRYPAWSPDGTKIAFASFRDGDWEIYVMDANGSNQTNLTNAPGSAESQPAWSPDGTKIAFDGSSEIYVMDADGTNQTNLTNDPALDLFPWWSRDGSQIVFSSGRTGNYEIWVMNADGSSPTQLTTNSALDWEPRWSWGASVNYRSIGTETGVLYSVGDASISASSSTVTFGAGASLPTNVGVGDELTLTDSVVSSITLAQTVVGGDNTSPVILTGVEGGTDMTYVLFVSTGGNNDVTAVSGGSGLGWNEDVDGQCSDASKTGISLWTATGSPPAGPFNVDITWSKTGGNRLAAVLSSYSGVGNFEDKHGENQIGENDSSCAIVANATSGQLTLTSSVVKSMHVAAVAPRSQTASSSSYATVDSHAVTLTSVYVFEKLFDTGQADIFTADFSGAVEWASAGVVLNRTTGGTGTSTLYVLSRDSDTQVTVQEAPTVNHVNASFAIKRAYRGFNSLQAWETDREGDLVAAGSSEVGVCYNDNNVAFTSPLLISGSTTDADHYITLTVAAGQRHNGTAGSGARIDAGGGFGVAPIYIQNQYTRVEWLEVFGFNDGKAAVKTHIDANGAYPTIENMIMHDYTGGYPGAGVSVNAAGAAVRNCIIYDGSPFGIYVGNSPSGAVIQNCTIYNTGTDGLAGNTGSTVSITNTISLGSVIDFALMGNVSFANNMFSTTFGFDPAIYTGNQSPPADLEDLFISMVWGFEDLHLEPTGHMAGNRGLDLSIDFTDDIDGATRTGPWDIGADEAIPGTAKPRIIRWTEVDPFRP